MRPEIFKFDNYNFNPRNGVVVFEYGLGNYRFREKLIFPKPIKKLIGAREEALDKALFNLFLTAGISYYKTYCPKTIDLGKYKISKEQAQFWNKVYTKGLGEFFYKNRINFHGLVKFPYEVNFTASAEKFKTRKKALVPLGGGKDSIITAELLKRKGMKFDCLSLRSLKIVNAVAKMTGKKLITIGRQLDKKLFTLKNTWNGHVPFSAYLAFVAEAAAILYNYDEIILSNEKSSEYGNVKYLGEIINHQWSKSYEFEKMFQNYAAKFITPSIRYYSLLRQWDELAIAKEFSRHEKYFPVFSSCNNNFKLTGTADKRWCGQCPKCVFTWTMLSAYLPKEKLEKIFGKNLYADKKLKPVFEELLGTKRHKPFECVGTPAEMKRAMKSAKAMGYFEKKYLILGFGLEGLSSLKFLLNKKIPARSITVADKNTFEQFSPAYRQALKKSGVNLSLGKNYLADLENFNVIAKTAGIKLDEKLAKKLAGNGVEITTNLNLFLAEIKGKIVGVTGTKGKSTTATLIYKILKAAGKRVILCGNIGKPFLDCLKQGAKNKIFVAEVSSYQLDTLKGEVNIGVMTSFFPEHLNYHGNLKKYFQAKMNLARASKIFVYNENFQRIKNFVRQSKIKASGYNKLNPKFKGLAGLMGEHNGQNIAGAVQTAKLFGVKDGAIQKALKKMKSLEHRLEYVGKFRGINFYNDVLSTAPESTIEAIKALTDKNLFTIIVGGFDRGLDYKKLALAIMNAKIKNVIYWPNAGTKIAREIMASLGSMTPNIRHQRWLGRISLGSMTPNIRQRKWLGNLIRVKNMPETVAACFKYARGGESVVLSPAASSYDFYQDYREKGAEYKKLIRAYGTKN